MSEEYLKSARKSGQTSDTPFSEPELIQTREDIRESWELLEAIRAKIFEEKREALTAIDEKYHDELKDAEATYAMLISLAR